jgi:cAMP-dependent protein kinase regulator
LHTYPESKNSTFDDPQEKSEDSNDGVMSKEEEEALIKKKNARRQPNGSKKNSRKGISAEVFGDYNKKEEFKAKVYKKTEQSFTFIKNLLMKSIMFMNLSEENLKIVIDAMQERKCLAEEQIITEGEAGDMLYVIGEGEFDCTKIIAGKKTFLKTYKTSDLFG